MPEDPTRRGTVTGGDEEGTDTAQPSVPKPRNWLWRWLAGRSLSQLGRLGVLIVLAVTAAFGGLDTVDDHVTTVAVGEGFDDGPFTVTVDRARLVPQLAAGNRVVLPPQPGRQYLAVVATFVSGGPIPVVLANEMEPIGVDGAIWAKAVRIADGSTVIWLGPGLTDQLALVWSVPEGTLRVGDSVTIKIWKKRFSELVVTYGRTWVDSITDYGQFAVPVTNPS